MSKNVLGSGWVANGALLSLCAGGAWFWWGVLQPAQVRVDEWRVRTARTHNAQQDRRADSTARIMLPPEAAFPDTLGVLARAAQDAGLAFDEGSYQVARQAQGTVVRYEITMPLHGTYPQLRGFLSALATALPGLAVDNVQLQRRKLDEAALDARLRLAIRMEARP